MSPGFRSTDIDAATLYPLLAGAWNVTGSLHRVGGESLNFRVDADDGRRFVLKLLEGDEPGTIAGLETRIVAHLASRLRDLRVPRTIPARDGTLAAALTTTDGRTLRARLLDWVDGTSWCDAPPASDARFRHLGGTLARVARALSDFSDDAAQRTHPWDLTRADTHAPKIRCVPDAALRERLERAFTLWRAHALPRIAHLPHSVIHGDANDENLLVRDDRVTGLLDFGDALRNPRVCELAIALAYTLLDAPDPLAGGALVVGGWHAVVPLTADELAVLFPLLCGRLAVSLVIAADRRRSAPDHPSWFVTEPRARALLARLVDIPPLEAGRTLAGETGIDPFPGARPLEQGALLEQRRQHIGPALSIAYREPLTITRGRGPYLFDDDERPYLDLVNNVCHVGHVEPRVVAAGQAQMARLNTNTRYLHDAVLRFAERICATLPAPLEVCWFVNSGSEANELALRIACAVTGRRDLLVVDAAYHGNTERLIALSPYKFKGPGGSGTTEPWVHVTPLPDGYRGIHRGFTREAGVAYGEEVGRAIALAGAPIAAFLFEPLPSCGGQIVPPPGWLQTACARVRDAGGLCIADEVQTGFGRVGTHFWAFQLQDVVPDIVVLGKPIGNGHPIGAVITTRAIADAFAAPGMEFFSTFGGNPVSCAIGNAVLDVIEQDGLQQHAAALGDVFLEGLRDLVERHPFAGHARGAGLFLGLELVRDPDARTPATTLATDVVEAMKRRGFLLSTDGPDHNVLKIKPPLVLSRDDVAATLRALDDALLEAPTPP